MKQMMLNSKLSKYKYLLSAISLALALSACGVPIAGTNSPGNDNSADGKVMVENKVYTEAEARKGIECYKGSSNEGVKQIATQFETTLNAALVLKSKGLNIQYETSLQALIQAMVLFDRTSPIDCMN